MSSSSARQSLVAVVVTHNRLPQLKTTVSRLLSEHPEHLDQLVVVDNASGSETQDWLADQDDPRLCVVRSARNLGGAGGFDMGLRAAVDQFDPDWIVVMDDDARPCPGAFEVFHQKTHDPAIALAAAVYFPDGRVCEMNRPSVNPFWAPRVFLRTLLKWRDGYHIPYAAYETSEPRAIDLTSFVGLFLSRRMVQVAGFPNPNLFLYGDDVIYTLHLRRLGFSIHFDPAIRFEHDCSTFENDRRRVFRPLWKVYYTYRNGLLMYRAAAGPLFWLMLPVLAVKWRLAASRYGADRAVYLRLLRAALADAVRARVVRRHEDVLEMAGA